MFTLATIAPQILAQSSQRTSSLGDKALDQHITDLLSRMTLEEKAAQMQDQAPAIFRLGIPAYGWWNEALHGVAYSGYATNFPQAIGLAATWDTGLTHDVAEVISVEARAKHSEAIRHDSHARFYGLSFWLPNVNIFRDPRWGRGQETYGEDPFLTSRIGVSFVTGLQGNDPEHPRVIATPKHFAVHSGPENSRHTFDVLPSAYDLEDTYLPAFRATLKDARAGSVMCAYNAINGQPACANDFLLKTHLRDAWGFGGYVVSDCGAIDDIFGGHHFMADAPSAAAVAVKAGTDLDCGHIYRHIPGAVKLHLLTEAEVDTAVRRLFVARARLGNLDGPEKGAYASIPFEAVNSAEHRQLALRAARKSMVLLKNSNGTLPLKNPDIKIAVIGPAADYLASVQGNYSGTPLNPVLPLSGMLSGFGNSHVRYAQGSTFVRGTLLPISRSALKPEKSAGEHGLTGQYFNKLDFSGPPVLVRTDETPNFNFTEASPGPGVAARTFAVRWSGTFTPPASGEYRLGVHLGACYACEDRVTYRMFLDSKLLLDSQHLPAGSDRDNANVTLELADSSSHAIVVEYTHREAGGQVDIVWEPPAKALLEEAIEAARTSDVVVAFVGLSTNLEGEEMKITLPGFSGGDRTTLNLPEAQQTLLEGVAAAGKPLIVVLLNGSALAVNWAQQHAAAIVEAWYPGEQGGTAIADTLLGRNNPAGRLPVTFYQSADQLPPFENYSMKGRTYRYFDGVPLFPFGYGLSYTTFAYSAPKFSKRWIRAGDQLNVQVDVTNIGKVEGDEVAQLYLLPLENHTSPKRTLRGFQRIHLAPGKTQTITFQLKDRDLSLVDQRGRRSVGAGRYRIFVGGGQPNTGAPGGYAITTITGSKMLPM
jgi:beta-glucosidase